MKQNKDYEIGISEDSDVSTTATEKSLDFRDKTSTNTKEKKLTLQNPKYVVSSNNNG